MRKWLPVVGLLLVAAVAAGAPAERSTKWPKYEGAWFEIRYPAGFKVRPGMHSLSSAKGHDSAYFTAPDGSVEFYVFSPQWNGEAKEIEADPKKERVISTKTEKRPESNDKPWVTTRWVTVRALNGSYTRSFVDTETGYNTRLIFGYRYRDERTRAKYQADYLAFKGSLVQFAD